MREQIQRQMQNVKGFNFDEAFGCRKDYELAAIARMLAAMTDEQKRTMTANIKRIATEQRRHVAARTN